MTPLVAVTTYGRRGAGARVRVFEWLDRVAPAAPVCSYTGTGNNSPATLLSQPLATAAAERAVRRLVDRPPSRLLIHRQASPFGRGALEEQLLRSAGWGVYDFDDGLPWDLAGRGPRRLFRSSAGKCLRSVRSADRVIAGNEILADWSSQFARDVVVIPSCVDPHAYRVKTSYEIADPPRLVWIGSASGEGYLRTIAEPLLQLHRETGARLTVVGDATARLAPLAAMTDRIPWQEGRAERQLCEFDVGLGPLTDDRFSRAKCAYKLLQYGAAGLPFVASPVGVNETVTARLAGLPAGRPAEWVDQVRVLLGGTADDRRARGEAGRDAVLRAYSFDAWLDRWTAALGLPATGSGSARP